MFTHNFAGMILLDEQKSSVSAEREEAEKFCLTRLQHLGDTKQIILNKTLKTKKIIKREGTLGV